MAAAFSVRNLIGTWCSAAISFEPPRLYSVPGTLDWSNAIFFAPSAIAVCVAPSAL